jgi:hypothetical protein
MHSHLLTYKAIFKLQQTTVFLRKKDVFAEKLHLQKSFSKIQDVKLAQRMATLK